MDEEQALPGMEPEAVEEEAGDPAPAPVKRGRGRPKGSKNKVARERGGSSSSSSSSSAPASEVEDKAPAVRASRAAIAGAQNLYGTAGAAISMVGQFADVPGAIVAGFVVQQQSLEGGKVVAKRAAGTRWYPYLERAGSASELAPLVLGPLCAALFVELPPLRPLLAPMVEQQLAGMTGEVLDAEGTRHTISAFEILQRTCAEVDLARQGREPPIEYRQAPPAAEPVYGPEPAPDNGAGPVPGDPEPVDHVSPVREAFGMAEQPPAEGEVA